MSERIYVKPGFQRDHKRQPTKELLRLVDPKTGGPVPDYGAAVNLDTYWIRRLECGDAIKIEKAEFEAGRDAAQKKRAEERKQAQAAPVAPPAPPAPPVTTSPAPAAEPTPAPVAGEKGSK